MPCGQRQPFLARGPPTSAPLPTSYAIVKGQNLVIFPPRVLYPDTRMQGFDNDSAFDNNRTLTTIYKPKRPFTTSTPLFANKILSLMSCELGKIPTLFACLAATHIDIMLKISEMVA